MYSEEGLIAEYDDTGAEIASYGYKPDSTWTTDPLWRQDGDQYYWYHNDHLGTPQKLTDSSGQVVWSAQYTAFGEAVIDTETVTNNLRFPGQYYDAETGLHYNWYRYYDSENGRYLSVDPIGFDGGDVNLYRYAGKNPLNFRDSRGLALNFTEEPPEIQRLDSLEGDSFSVHATRHMLTLYLHHDNEVGSVFFNPKHPLYDPNKYAGKTWTDCITYVERVLRYAYNMTGQHDVAKHVNSVAASGIDLAGYLKTQGWKVIYWNPDVNHPDDANTEHLEAWKEYNEQHKYYGVKVDALAINYDPTPTSHPKYKKWCNNPDYGPYVDCCPTKRDMSGYFKLKNVMFGVIMVRGATHNFLYSFGKTYEVHWDWPEGESLFLYEANDFLRLNWRDGIVIVPPDNGAY